MQIEFIVQWDGQEKRNVFTTQSRDESQCKARNEERGGIGGGRGAKGEEEYDDDNCYHHHHHPQRAQNIVTYRYEI
jgi:hypothetical protein